MIETLCCLDTQPLFHALKTIHQNGKGIVFLTDENTVLKGILTDGDIRRHILEGTPLDTPCHSLMQRHFTKASTQESHTDLLQKTNEKIRIIPIVDSQEKVVDYFEFNRNVHIPVAAPDLIGNELKYLLEAFFSTWISSSGEYIQKFETQFADFCKTDHAVSVCNGTAAITLALMALGVGEGDEVIVPDLTFAATANAVIMAKATPVIVDIDPVHWGLCPIATQKAITPRTKALLPVHLYGQPCNMAPLMALAKTHALYVIEDCAEAHGATYHGQPVGSIGDVGCFSFFANKVLTTGEGGMCITQNAALAEKLRLFRDHGMSREKKYFHTEIGFNFRMTNLQAAIGVAQLERIETLLQIRDTLENHYKKTLIHPDVTFMPDLPNQKRINWLTSITVPSTKRDDILAHLKQHNIECRPFFYPLSQMPIYKPYTHPTKISLQVSQQGINLPTTITLNEEKINHIVTQLMEAL